MAIKLISSDLNGTLVHQHTMSDLIRLYGQPENFTRAKNLFDDRLAGKITVSKLLNGLAPLSKGITLRNAIEYVENDLEFIKGFDKYIEYLENRNIPLVINSTGYSVTMYTIREIYGQRYFDHFICNKLEFGWNADQNRAVDDDELEELIEAYFRDKKHRKFGSYDDIRATGRVRLTISEESAKTGLLLKYLTVKYPGITLDQVVHIGDTMGDSHAIVDIARAGGIGIAFNYNEPLEKHLIEVINTRPLLGTILMIDEKGGAPDLNRVIKTLAKDPAPEESGP